MEAMGKEGAICPISFYNRTNNSELFSRSASRSNDSRNSYAKGFVSRRKKLNGVARTLSDDTSAVALKICSRAGIGFDVGKRKTTKFRKVSFCSFDPMLLPGV